MRPGDIVRVDFGEPVGHEPGFIRPAVVVTADAFLAVRTGVLNVVPLTSTGRGWLAEVATADHGFAQCWIVQSISPLRVVEVVGNVGAAALTQIREVLADVLGIGV
jgi:mRNA interferase MazF